MRIESLYSALAYFPDLENSWRPHDLVWTESNLRSQLEAERGLNHARTIELLAKIARVRGLNGDLVSARLLLDEALDLLAKTDGVPSTQLRLLLEQGRFFALSRSSLKSQALFLQAWEMAVASKYDFLAIDAAVMLFTVAPLKGQNDWLLRAAQLVDSSADPQVKLWSAQVYMMQGWHAFDLRRYDEALLSFDAAIGATQSDALPAKVYPPLWGKARVLRALGRIGEALELQTTIRDRMQNRGDVDGHVYLEMAECNQLLSQHHRAREFFELAHASLSTDNWYVDNRSDELARMKYIFKKRT